MVRSIVLMAALVLARSYPLEAQSPTFVLVMKSVDAHAVAAQIVCAAPVPPAECLQEALSQSKLEISRHGSPFAAEPGVATAKDLNLKITVANALRTGDRVRLAYGRITSEDRCLYPTADDFAYRYDETHNQLR